MVSERIQRIIEGLLASAEEAVARSEWAAVGTHADDVLALDPDHGDALALRELAANHVDSSRPPAGRRQLSVLFSDIVGSTAMAEQLDPEAVQEILTAYQEGCGAAVDRFGGMIHQFLGDGIVAYFCYPRTHEDDARRAVLAGLDALDRCQRIAGPIKAAHGIDLAIRVGVHTGLVAIRDWESGGKRQPNAIAGTTPNLAARLQEVAEPGSLMISGATYELVRYYFDTEPLGATELKGVSRAVDVHRVTRSRGTISTIDIPSARFTPMVNRVTEVELLESSWQQTLDAWGTEAAELPPVTPILLSGEPGIGKTRLASLLHDRARGSGGRALILPCSPLAPTALQPLRTGIERYCGIQDDDPPSARLEKLANHTAEPDDVLGHVATLLDIDPAAGYQPVAVAPIQRREATLAALLEWLTGIATRSPHLLIADDLHWADPTTLDLLDRLVRHVPPGLMPLLTARPDFARRWGERVTEVNLTPLSDHEIRKLVDVAVDGDVPRPTLTEIADKSDGVPLFAEQLAHTLPRDGSGDVHPTEIPHTLQDLLQAQLDASGTAKTFAQVAATVGREFDVELLADVTRRLHEHGQLPDVAPEGMSRALRRLGQANLIEPTGADGRQLRFHHVLVRDAAYESQLLDERSARHQATALALVERESQEAALVALHFDLAGHHDRAAAAYLDASKQARRSGEFLEAHGQVERAIELLTDLPPDTRTRLELLARIERGAVASATQGYAAPGVVEDYQAAADLCREVSQESDAARDMVTSLSYLWSYWITHGDLDTTRVVADQLTAQLELTDTPNRASSIPSFRGTEAFYRGDLTAARDLLIESRDAFDPEEYGPSGWELPHDMLAAIQALLCPLLLVTGDLRGAHAAHADGLARAQSVGAPTGPFSEAFVQTYASWMYRMSGDPDSSLAAARHVIEIGERHGYLEWTMLGRIHLGAAGAEAGSAEDVMSVLGPSLDMWRSLGADLGISIFLVEKAEGLRQLGRLDEAQQTIDDAINHAESKGQHVYLAEAIRSRAAIAAAAGADPAEVSADLRRSLTTAARQGAHLYILRTGLSAHQLLPYDEFLNGFGPALCDAIGAFGDDASFPALEGARRLVAR